MGPAGSQVRPRTEKARFPDFLIMGAQKAGTSWLASNLSRHPDVWTPPLKEIHYFDQRMKEASFGVSLARLCSTRYTNEAWYPWYWRNQSKRLLKSLLGRFGEKPEPGTASWAFEFLARPPSDAWYASLFEQARGRTAGEATPEYAILEEGTVARVHELMPDARIFFMRNPIGRLYSSALMRLRHLGEMGRKTEPDDGFFGRFFWETEVVAETKYLRSLERWRRFYADEQIFVGFLEDVHFDPARLLQRLHVFLGVDPSRAPQVERRKVHATSHETMPTRIAVHLARAYHKTCGTSARASAATPTSGSSAPKI